MNDINSIVIVGNVVRDCGSDPNGRDFAYTQGGMAIATVSIASNRSRKMADGSWQDEASFFDVKLFGKTAENLKQYLVKGQKIAVEGAIKQERWQTQDGKNMSKVVLLANSVQLLGGKPNQAPQAQTWQQGQQQYQQQKQQTQQQYVQNGMVPQFVPVQNQDGFPEDVPF